MDLGVKITLLSGILRMSMRKRRPFIVVRQLEENLLGSDGAEE